MSVQDARAVAALLAANGYVVTLVVDATKAELEAQFEDFLGALYHPATRPPVDTDVVVFYAGHAVDCGGSWLAPLNCVWEGQRLPACLYRLGSP